MPRIVATPIAPVKVPDAQLAPRSVAPDVVAAVLPGPGRDRLAHGDVLVVTTGQQPGLFTGPLYTVYKALSAMALARRLERERRTPVVPVFWVAGDDHDFAEANHAWVLDTTGEPAQIVLRERPLDAPLVPLFREPCGEEVRTALERLRALTPETEFKAGVVAWLEAAYRPEANLADAFAEALAALLGPRGLAVFRAYHPAAKRAAAPWVLKGLALTLPDGLTPVMVEADAGRDRLRAESGGDRFVTRRSGEAISGPELATRSLSPNVLLRPVVEAALFPSVAYAAGPAELEYWKEAAPLFEALDVNPQAAVARWSGVLVEARVDKVLRRHGIGIEDVGGPAGALEARLARDALPPEVGDALAAIKSGLEDNYRRLETLVEKMDPTLKRTVQTTRNAALVGLQDLEKKLVHSSKRANAALLGQIARARAALAPTGKPQERVLTLASFLIRYGPGLVDAIDAEVARWADPS